MKKRLLSVFLALTMFISAFPVETVVSLGADLAETYCDGLCPHHKEHNSDCGYIPISEGTPCTHEHTSDCYTLTEDCVHIHDEKCYSDGLLPNEGVTKEADACSHICSKENGCLTPTESCAHEHDSKCGYAEAIEGHSCEFVCEICSFIVSDWVWEDTYDALLSGEDYGLDDVDWVIDISRFDELDQDDIQAVLREMLPHAVIAQVKTGKLINLDITWDLDKEHSEGALCTAELPKGYTMDEGAPALTVLVRDAEDGIYNVAAQDDAVKDTPTKRAFKQPDKIGEALHFIVRHWHSKDSTDGSSFQGDSLEKSGSRYFTVVEGYIVPTSDSEKRNDVGYDDNYHFYLVCQDNTEIGGKPHSKGDLVEIRNDGYVNGEDDDYDSGSAYVVSIDHASGEIVLSTNALKKDSSEKYAETFSAYSVTTGHDAVTENKDGTLSIEYDPSIHIAKAHAFYTKTTIDVTSGVEDDTVFGASGIVADNEHDTVWVYTYTNTTEYHKEGEIVKIGGNPVKKGEEGRLQGITDTDVELTKVYDSSEGLHTDKSATAHDDGRTFDIDLEAWHSKGYAEQIAMVFDASGSMAFASDVPSPIKVTDGSGLWNELKDKIGYVKNNGFDKTEQITFSKEYQLLGYYEISPNSDGGLKRNWYLNSKKKKPSTNYADFTTDDFAMAVAQSTSDSIDFTGAQHIIESTDMTFLPNYSILENWCKGWGTVPANFSEKNGFNLTYKNEYGNSGFMLEAGPENVDNFTISFTLNQAKALSCGEDIEILYIGANSGDNNYFHVIRSGNDIIAYVGGEEKVKIENAFSNIANEQHKISFVFENNKLTTYLDGAAYGDSVGIEILSGNTVVFAPFKDSNEQEEYFYVDSIFLFDTALDEKKIQTVVSFINDGSSLDYDNAAFLTPKELALLMDPHNTDNSKLGFAGYSYFVYDPSSNTNAYNPLSYYTNDIITPNSRKNNVPGQGWYYVNCGNWESLYSKGTAKQLYGIASSWGFNDTINPGATTANSGEGAAPNIDKIENNTDLAYTATDASPVKFYIDEDGYLRCFFATTIEKRYTSFVYKLEDSQYIRTEALQRAIGVFATELAERSPASRVSAVRFSSNDISGTDKRLVLLDWTDNHSLATKMFSFEWGGGNVMQSKKSESYGLDQYDYALTGGTYTSTGLQAYIDYLMKNDNPYDAAVYDKVPKYLVLFTDGADSNGGVGSCTKQIQALRDKGYTIFTVLLDGGTISGTEYAAAKAFLTELSGGEEHFYSVSEAKEKLGSAADNMNDADILTQIFAEDVLNEITKPLDDYIVSDYIDPRFDLVQETGDGNIIWHLNAKGKIQLENTDRVIGEYELSDSTGKQFDLTDESDDVAQHPTLYYDETNDMYYLEWTDQTIPGSAVGASSLAVWNARFTIRAKEDFLGGNAILTNGNSKNMNYVFYSTDQNPSSGTDKAVPKNDNDKASKGFPRVSVNVELLDVAIGTDELRVYLGEEIDPIQAIEALSETVDGDYYWLDYLMRYAVEIKKVGDDLSADDLMEIMLKQLADDPSGWGMDIPYYYLPNVVESEEGVRQSSTNQTGILQQKDQIGVLHYRWERLDPQTGEVIDVGGYANEAGSTEGGPYKGVPYQTLDTRRIEYRLVVSYWPFPDPDAEFWKALDEWAATTKYVYDDTVYTKELGDPVIHAVLDDMWALLEKETVTGAVGGLSARVQSANEPKDMGSKGIVEILTEYENGKYNGNISDYLNNISGSDKDSVSYQYLAIKEKLVEADFPEKITEHGTFNELLKEVYSKLYEDTITITIKTTDEKEQYEELKIDGGLKGLIDELAIAKQDQESQTKRVYIETELFQKRNEIDNLISQMANYIDYLRWCYGYGEREDQEESKVPVQEWLGEEYEKFSERTDANHALINDVTRTDRKGDKVENSGGTPQFEYAYWDAKEAEGEPQYNKTAVGMSTIRVIRGELAFELELNMEDLLYLFKSGSWKDYSGDNDFVPFYIDLKRESDIEWSRPVIPQLEIDISKSDLLKLTEENQDLVTGEIKTQDGVTTLYYLEDYEYEEENEQGQKVTRQGKRATEYPKAVYYHDNYNGTAADQGTVIFYSDPRDLDPIYKGFDVNKDYARLLPIGTYTMTASTKNDTYWSMFDLEMFYASNDNYKFDSWHFTRTTNEGEPNNSVESLYFPRSGRSQTAGLGQLKAPETNLKNGSVNGELADKTKGVVFELGTHIYTGSDEYSGDSGNIPQYTDDRAGMARVKGTMVKMELPATGGSGTNIYYLLGTALVLLGGVCLIFLDRRSKKKAHLN